MLYGKQTNICIAATGEAMQLTPSLI